MWDCGYYLLDHTRILLSYWKDFTRIEAFIEATRATRDGCKLRSGTCSGLREIELFLISFYSSNALTAA